MNLIEKIRSYRLGVLDGSAAEGLLTTLPMPLLCATLSTILKAEDGPLIDDACLVIRDCALLTSSPDREAFQVGLAGSGIIQQLEANLLSHDHITRSTSVYTLGKLCSQPSLPALQTAFAAWRDRDPLLVPQLVFEMAWLGADKWDLLDLVLDSPVYPTRWSAIECLGGGIETAGDAEKYDPRKLHHLQMLQRDENGLVRDEANYYFEILTADIPRDISRGERKIRTKAIHAQKPQVTFAKCCIQFGNYLSQSGQRTYSLEQLLEFIDHLTVQQT